MKGNFFGANADSVDTLLLEEQRRNLGDNAEIGCISVVIDNNDDMYLISREIDASYYTGKVTHVEKRETNGDSRPKKTMNDYAKILAVIKDNADFFKKITPLQTELLDNPYFHPAGNELNRKPLPISALDVNDQKKIQHAFNASSTHYQLQSLFSYLD